MERDRVEREADVEQRAGGLADAQADPVDDQARREGEGLRVGQEADEHAAGAGRVGVDPGVVVLEPERHVAGDQREAIGQADLDADRVALPREREREARRS